VDEVLKKHARSFYLTLKFLPAEVKNSISSAYLLARFADNFTDEENLSVETRLILLKNFQAALMNSAERISLTSFFVEQEAILKTFRSVELLNALQESQDFFSKIDPSESILITDVVLTLTQAMTFDLEFFNQKKPDSDQTVALQSLEDLEQYTYLAAGCVGDFWTRLCMLKIENCRKDWDFEQIKNLGILYGKALQWTNVLRDVASDLTIGRCYLPQEWLAQYGLTTKDLGDTENFARFQSLYLKCIEHNLSYYLNAVDYIKAIPKSEIRLRAATALPALIGLKTLLLLAQADENSNPLSLDKKIKIDRSEVYGLLANLAATSVFSDRFYRQFDSLLAKFKKLKLYGHQ